MTIFTPPAQVAVRELTAPERAAWDAYVRAAPGGLPLHLSGWRDVLHATYGYETDYLMAWADDAVVGVLPLFFVPSRLTGRRAMTLPGGLCAESEDAAAALLARGWQTAVSRDARRLVLQDTRRAWPDAGQTHEQHVFWLCELPETADGLWRALDGNIRRQVRIARRNELRAQIDRTGDLLDPFYDVFSRFVHQAGTPVFGRDFLAHVIDVFPGGFNIVVVWQGQRPIAGYFQLEMGETVYGMWGAALPDTLSLRPVYLAIWEMLADAIEQGFAYLDMGRSPAASNASKFKGQWGGVSRPVYQQIWQPGSAEAGQSVTHQLQSDGKFHLFTQLWPRLPLGWSRRLGPWLRWHVPFA